MVLMIHQGRSVGCSKATASSKAELAHSSCSSPCRPGSVRDCWTGGATGGLISNSHTKVVRDNLSIHTAMFAQAGLPLLLAAGFERTLCWSRS